MNLGQLRAAIETDREAWMSLLASDVKPDDVVSEIYGYSPDVPVELRLAQALHHGTEHRIQICTALTSLGIEPPWIDPFTWWRERQPG
jgi:uncharacterized damage-inducible protein DinB